MRKAVVRKQAGDDTKYFVDQMAQKAGLNESDAEFAVDVLISTIPKVLKNKDSIEFSKLGKFSVEYKQHQTGPHGKDYKIVKFEPGGEVKEVAGSCRTEIR
jgi:nucleoid DNA-binding protein